MESTVIVTVPLPLVGAEIEKVPGVSSSKVKDWLEKDKVAATGAGLLLLPPPPPPQEANVKAARFANTSEDLPFN